MAEGSLTLVSPGQEQSCSSAAGDLVAVTQPLGKGASVSMYIANTALLGEWLS